MPNDVTADVVKATDIRKFFGHRPLYIIDPDRIQVVKPSPTDSDVFTIYGPDRLFWVNVYEIDNENRFEARLSTVQNPSSVLCYWLPWRKDGMVRIRLKVSKKYGVPVTNKQMQAEKSANDSSLVPGRATGGAITRPELDRTAGDEPRLFFTGMMDGCSTWIAGDPAEPVVYHINRASHPDAVAKQDVYKRESEQHKIKTTRMTQDFQALQSVEKPKDTGGFVGVTPDKHKMHHNAGGVQPKWRQQMKSGTGVGGEVKVLKQYTSTFGLKPDGTWTFYAQDIYEYRAADQFGNAVGVTLYTAGKPQKKFPG